MRDVIGISIILNILLTILGFISDFFQIKGSVKAKTFKIICFILIISLTGYFVYSFYYGESNILTVDEILTDYKKLSAKDFKESYTGKIKFKGKSNSSSANVLILIPDDKKIEGQIHCYGKNDIALHIPYNTNVTVRGIFEISKKGYLQFKDCEVIKIHE